MMNNPNHTVTHVAGLICYPCPRPSRQGTKDKGPRTRDQGLFPDAREQAAGCPAEEGRTNQHVDDVAAVAFIEAPETRRLSERQPQSGHFEELRTNPADEFVHNAPPGDLGEQNAVHAAGASSLLEKSRVTACFGPDFNGVEPGRSADLRQIGMANSTIERKCPLPCPCAENVRIGSLA